MPELDANPQSSKMSFAELARLSADDQFERTVVENGYRLDQRLLQCIELFHRLPQEMQTWAQRRNLSQRELQPLLALESLPDDLLITLAEADVSRNYGAQILELLVDNILLGHLELAPPAPFAADKAAQWITQLKTLRFPETTRRDDERKEKLTGLPWPKGLQTRWQRQGDRSGLEVRFTISDKADLEGKIEALQRVLENYND